MVLLNIYLGFLKIGALAFGGGYAMLPFIRTVLVNEHHWVTASQLNSYVGLVQIAPGPFTVNLSTYVGFKVAGFLGALVAILGLSTAPFILVTIFYLIFKKLKDSKTWGDAIKGMKPALIALIVSAFVGVTKGLWTEWRALIIIFISGVLLLYKKMQPVTVIVIAAILGIILYM